jgi:hypothetical protein
VTTLKRPRAYDDEKYLLFMGIGSVSSGMAPEEPEPEPGLWLPMERSGSRMGGWHLTPFTPAQSRAQIGFQRRSR